MTRRGIVSLTLIFCVCLFVRYYGVAQSPETVYGGLGSFFDSKLYHVLGFNLSKGHGFVKTDFFQTLTAQTREEELKDAKPAFSRGPLYPVFIAVIYKWFTNHKDMQSIETWYRVWDQLRLAQCVLDTLTCGLVFLITRLLSKDLRTAYIATGLYTFSFYNIYYSKAILPECLTTFLLTLLMLLCSLFLMNNRRRYLIAGAGVAALLTLTRGEYILLVPAMALAYVVLKRNQPSSKALKDAGLFALLFIICLVPWTLRNLNTFGDPVIVSRGGLAKSFYDGSWVNSSTWISWDKIPEHIFYDQDEQKQALALREKYHVTLLTGTYQQASDLEAKYMSLYSKRFGHAPLKTIWNGIRNIPRLWYQDYIPLYREPEPSGLFFIFYFGFTLYAFISDKDRRYLMLPILLSFVYLTVIFIPLWVEPRYGVPVMPGLIVLCAMGLTRFIRTLPLPSRR